MKKKPFGKIRYFAYQQFLKMEIACEGFYYISFQKKHNASIYTDRSIDKMQYTILRENHTIEKAMSLPNPRKGFGQAKVLHLIDRLDRYIDLYLNTDQNFLVYPFATIKHYIEYTEQNGTNIDRIHEQFNQLAKRTNFSEICAIASTKELNKEEILEQNSVHFENLLKTRHSIRMFSNKVPSIEILTKALELAQLTPSACNRQAWKTHIFFNNKCQELIKWQSGAQGFEDQIHCAILVTSNANAFLNYEIHQAFIDGGLYAMNLINALHSLGLGTIPLSCGFYHNKIQGIYNFSVPQNEIPIIIIGTGILLDKFKVAISERKPIISTNTFHQ